MKDANEKLDVVQLIIGFNLASRRERLGVRAEQICDGLGISAETLLAFESGRRRPDVKTLVAFARMLDVSPQYFFSIPKHLDARSRAQLRSAHGGIGDRESVANDAVAVMRAFARMKNRPGRHVVSDVAQAISGFDS
jgi:transcriptional regulator with XRE-family HTH domain